MSNPLGLVLGQLMTPLMVPSPGQIPILNLAWFMPAIPGFLLTVIGVNSSLPPTPPSPSAASAKTTQKRPFLGTIMKLVKNKAFLVIFLFLGGAMGYISTLQTKLEQVNFYLWTASLLLFFSKVLCSKGYSDSLAGLAAAIIIISGFIASFPLGYLSIKSGKLILISKVCSSLHDPCHRSFFMLLFSVHVFLQLLRLLFQRGCFSSLPFPPGLLSSVAFLAFALSAFTPSCSSWVLNVLFPWMSLWWQVFAIFHQLFRSVYHMSALHVVLLMLPCFCCIIFTHFDPFSGLDSHVHRELFQLAPN